ncbi:MULTISPECIES: acyl-CoA thioesterase [Sphingobium]|uniref:acyl-CoA thioesterase n=1 Tax=Sphingobium sp. MI1205 TaxID=407020 RepID=UPI00076FF726|nr:acyl-CoA thioesterase domain-containing protein [Sphingobium sp. MI1205]AMK19860.1 acyl-CoA thioesterase II [Sphingobium sp. MI1205]
MRRYDATVYNGQWSKDIPTLLELDEVGPDRFRNRHNQRNVYRALFGGQIVAQALAAADRTAPGRTVHSLHAYFLRAGTDIEAIDYQVERIRDGGRFSTRRVVAQQKGQTLFTMECSYRTPVNGFSHYRPSPIPFDPENAFGQDEFSSFTAADGKQYGALFHGHYPIEVRLPGKAGFLEPTTEAKRHYWLRAPGTEGIDDPAVQRQIFAFLSDFMLAGAPLAPHTIALPGPHLFVASLDHCIWFHRDVRCDDWLLFETEGPNAENGVNMARGLVYNRAGELVASLAQEALQYETGDEAGA